MVVKLGQVGERSKEMAASARSENSLNALKALRDRLRSVLVSSELRALDHAISLLSSDFVSEGAVTRLANGLIRVTPVRRRGGDRVMDDPRSYGDVPPEFSEDEDA